MKKTKPKTMQSASSSPVLPTGWVQYIDNKSTKTYYVHLPTGDTQWMQPLLPPTMAHQLVSYDTIAANNTANSRKSKMATYILMVGILVLVFLSGNYVGRHRSSSSTSVIEIVEEEQELPSSVTNIDISSKNEDDTNSKPSTSRNRFWKYIQDNKAGLLGENIDDDDGTIYDYYDVMELCLKNKQSEPTLLNEETQSQQAQQKQQPMIVDTVQDTNNRTVLVEISNAITPSQAQSVKDLAACTRQYFPPRFDERAFEDSGGGNDVTFINILLQLFLPDLATSMDYVTKMAYDHAEWGRLRTLTLTKLPEPITCGLRTSEYLDYGKFKGLGGHSDAGSLYTVLFALSNPKMYKGGEYYVRPQDDEEQVYYYFKPRQYSVIVFLSDTYHGVTDIESGVREMFTNEYWEFDDPPWHSSLRPNTDDMDLFTKKCDSFFPIDYYRDDKINGRKEYYKSCEEEGSADYMWPSQEETEAYIMDMPGRQILDEGRPIEGEVGQGGEHQVQDAEGEEEIVLEDNQEEYEDYNEEEESWEDFNDSSDDSSDD